MAPFLAHPVCDHDTETLRTDRQTDRVTDDIVILWANRALSTVLCSA